MSIRQTSIDCYNKIKANGLLSKRRLQTLEVLIKIAPCTATELQNSMDYNDGGRDCMKRLSELRDLGVIYEKTERNCSITGRNVIEWDLTDKIPINRKVITNTKKDRINNTLKAFRELYKNKNNSVVEDWEKVADLIKSI
jgi:hypothetical protein